MTRITAKLALEVGLKEADVRRIMLNAPVRYKTYPVSRPSGRPRLISQPTAEVKILQRALCRVLLDGLPVHSAATAYRKGHSIADNVRPHLEAGPILKLDLKDFFPSIRSQDWVSYCRDTGCLTEPEDVFLTSHLLFHRRRSARVMRLAIGAPSSPVVSNIMMFNIDRLIAEKVSEDHITYTRYADDMTFSALRTGYLVRTISDVAKIIRNNPYPKLELNDQKTTYVTKKFGRRVTGITITNDGDASIGHERKRKVRAAVHRAKLGTLSKDELRVLSGMLAYINVAEPSFLDKLGQKYGADTINRIKKAYFEGNKLPPHDPPLAYQ